MPTELVLLGVIASIFLVIFFFLYIELSTRKRRLVQDIKIILRDIPSKLSEHKREEQSKLNSISELLKLELEEEEYRSRKAEEEIRNQYVPVDDFGRRNPIYEKEAKSIIHEATTLRNKMTWLDALSIGELEKIQATIEKYYNKLSKSGVDIISALSRVNSMLDHFIPKYGPKRTANV